MKSLISARVVLLNEDGWDAGRGGRRDSSRVVIGRVGVARAEGRAGMEGELEETARVSHEVTLTTLPKIVMHATNSSHFRNF